MPICLLSAPRRVFPAILVACLLVASPTMHFMPVYAATYVQEAELIGDPTATCDGGLPCGIFGTTVAVSGDGNTALVATRLARTASMSTPAYVFTRTAGAWRQQQQLLPPDVGVGDTFGYSLALSADGSTAVIGAPGKESEGKQHAGAVYLFSHIGETWIQQQEITASDTLAMDAFGAAVAASGDGSTVVVGMFASSARTGGGASVFVRDGATWRQEASLVRSDATDDNSFGQSVALSADGNTALIGAYLQRVGPSLGAAHLFARTGGAWSQRAVLTARNSTAFDDLGFTVALNRDGNTAAIGAPGKDTADTGLSGAVYIFTATETGWTQQELTEDVPTTNHMFGNALALSGDGTTLVVGVSFTGNDRTAGAGRVYLFTRSDGRWDAQPPLAAQGAAAGDAFGYSVALSENGATVLVAAPGRTVGSMTGAGSAVIFRRG